VVENLEDLRSGQFDGTHWVPAEVDVSIRPGWYYHPFEDHKVKSLPHLLDIYYNSIGRNSSLLINFPVDTRGLIHENDVEQILKLASAIKEDFKTDLAKSKKVSATNTRGNSKKYRAENLVDGNPKTYWTTNDNIIQSSVTINFNEPTEFNRFLAQEYIQLGQRVKAFTLEAFVENEWVEIASQTTIGRKRILRLPNIIATKIRLNIVDAKACPVLFNIGVYKAPKVLVEPIIQRSKDGIVSIKAFDTGLEIIYSSDGSEPDENSQKFTEPFKLNKKATIKAIAIDIVTGKKSPVSITDFDVSKEKWKIVGEFADDEKAQLIFDGDPNTAWTLRSQPPFDFIFDLGETLALEGFKYLPDQGRYGAGIIFNYEMYVSDDIRKWGSPVSSGEFSNIKNSPVWQEKEIPEISGRYIKLKALSSASDNNLVGIAEFDIITK
jgi:alpha-L-fucosidase